MSVSSRRFEILLPLRFNDGQPVSDSMIADVAIELEKQFGAVSSETQIIRGLWQHEGVAFRDDLLRLFVDVADNEENLRFFVAYKERFKAMFGQLEIWITTYPIEVL